MKSTNEKIFQFVFGGFIEAGMFCIFWNIFETCYAVGHNLGTVNFWTALGVDYSICIVFYSIGIAWYSGKIIADEYSLLKESN